MTRLNGVAAVLLACCVLVGCDGSGGAGTDTAEAPPEAGPVQVSRPHFTGDLPVFLRTGRTYYSDEDCPEEDADKVCSPDGERTYLVFGEAARTSVVEARMDLAGGNTSWTVTVSFTPGSERALRRAREEARASGAVVLVLDRADEVLLVAPVERVAGRRIEYPLLSKSEAWNLVESFTER